MSQTIPQICYLSHAGFRMLGDPIFRLSEGTKVPSMVIRLEGQEAVLPLGSVAREFRVDAESADGQMLTLIEQALDFVVSIKIGDRLPSELNGGAASWEPTAQDRRIAASRIRHHLVRCMFARMGKRIAISGGGSPGWEDEPKNQVLVQDAIIGAAAHLDGTDEADVNARLAALCEEMAYIEFLRRSLARGLVHIRDKLLHIRADDIPISQRDTVQQVQALARLGNKEIMGRFDEVDVRLDDILAMLRDLPTVVAGLRRQRDWLFRTNRAWSGVFADWAAAPKRFDEFLLKIIERTYAFLAPRYMSFQEWTVIETRMKQAAVRAKVW